jgi:hypothetical protein
VVVDLASDPMGTLPLEVVTVFVASPVERISNILISSVRMHPQVVVHCLKWTKHKSADNLRPHVTGK